MSKPCIVCVDEEPARLGRLATLVEQKFGETYQLRCYSSSEECLEGLVARAEGNPSVASVASVPLVLCDESLHALIVQLEQHPVPVANVVLVRSGWEFGPLVDAIERQLTRQDESAVGSAAHQHAVEKKNASLEALHQIGVALASSFDIDSILRQITRAALLLLGNVPVDVFYAGSRKINSQPRWLPPTPTAGHLSQDDRTALEQRVTALADDDTAHDSATEAFESRRPDGRIDMGQIIPIAQQENVLGLIVVESSRSLSPEDLGLLSILSLQAATALHNIHITQERIHFERLSAVGRMIGSVVHDFRSPLTAVRGYAGMLASLTVSEEHRKEYARLIVEECDRLGGLTDELLELTRGSRTKPVIRRVDLADFFRDLEPSLEAQFMDSEVRLKVELGYGPVSLDSARIPRPGVPGLGSHDPGDPKRGRQCSSGDRWRGVVRHPLQARSRARGFGIRGHRLRYSRRRPPPDLRALLLLWQSARHRAGDVHHPANRTRARRSDGTEQSTGSRNGREVLTSSRKGW